MVYEPGGLWYVYFVYGLHNMLNVVVDPADYPAAILLRGVEGHAGPAVLTKALGIDRRYNGQPATRASGLYFADGGVVIPPRTIKRSPRIGVTYAGPIWSQKPFRFYL